MATVRFAKVVAKCGEPEAHLILIDPAKDRALQAAIKADRVMTVVATSDEGAGRLPQALAPPAYKPVPVHLVCRYPA